MALPVQSDPHMVVAVDYGTTNTGIAWMHVNEEGASLEKLKVFKAWPRQESTKVPSVISYSRTKTRTRQWGHDIDDQSKVLAWTKLELEPQSKLTELRHLLDTARGLKEIKDFLADPNAGRSTDVPRHLPKSAGDIVADYMNKVVRWWYADLNAETRSLFGNVPIRLVVTHPAGWSYEARNKIVRAVASAFPRTLFPKLSTIALCSEPEACAIYTGMYAVLNETTQLYPGDCFVVCDAGGGTVDLISYRMGSGHRFDIATRTLSTSSFLKNIQRLDDDMAAMGEGGHFVLSAKTYTVLQRFINVKHLFSGEGQTRGDIQLTSDWAEKLVDSPMAHARVSEGTLRLSRADFEAIFDPCVDAILKALAGQVAQIEAGDGNASHIFMSGGFSENRYLFKKVEEWADLRGIAVERGEDTWGAVVRGAVLMGAGQGPRVLEPVMFCPRSYGITLGAQPKGSKGKLAAKGQDLVENQMVWITKKGDLVLPGEFTMWTVPLKYMLPANPAVQPQGKLVITFMATRSDTTYSRFSDRGGSATDEVINFYIDPNALPASSWTPTSTSSLFGASLFNEVSTDITVKLEIMEKLTIKFICNGDVLVRQVIDIDQTVKNGK